MARKHGPRAHLKRVPEGPLRGVAEVYGDAMSCASRTKSRPAAVSPPPPSMAEPQRALSEFQQRFAMMSPILLVLHAAAALCRSRAAPCPRGTAAPRPCPPRRPPDLGHIPAKSAEAALFKLRTQKRGLFLIAPAPDRKHLSRRPVCAQPLQVQLAAVAQKRAAALQHGGYRIAMGVETRYHMSPRPFAAASSRSSPAST